jgi:hypothetical protein
MKHCDFFTYFSKKYSNNISIYSKQISILAYLMFGLDVQSFDVGLYSRINRLRLGLSMLGRVVHWAVFEV